MSSEDNKALVRRWYEEGLNQKKTAAIDEFIDPSFFGHSHPHGQPGGLEETKESLGMYLTAFPDLHVTIEDMIAEGDKVVSRLTGSATQQGAFMGIPPTGKHVTITAIDIIRIAGGKFVEHWSLQDTLGILQQLGVVPKPGQAR